MVRRNSLSIPENVFCDPDLYGTHLGLLKGNWVTLPWKKHRFHFVVVQYISNIRFKYQELWRKAISPS